MWSEFKTFISKGNVLELAVGIMLGVAFGKIVTSFVSDVLTPLISVLVGKIDFSNLFIALDGGIYPTLEEAKKVGVATLNYGLFANAVLDFLIVSFAIFMMIKITNKMKRQSTSQVTTKTCTECLSTIPLKARKCAFCGSSLEITDIRPLDLY